MYQLLVVGHPGDEVQHLVVVDGVGLAQLLGELVEAPGEDDPPRRWEKQINFLGIFCLLNFSKSEIKF